MADGEHLKGGFTGGMQLVGKETIKMLPIKLLLVVSTLAVKLALGEPTGMFEEVQPPNLSKFQPWTNPGPPYSEELTAPKYSEELTAPTYSEELQSPVSGEIQVAQDRSSDWETNWKAPR